MTPYEREALARLAEISANVAELGSWVVTGAFAGSFCAGLLVLLLIVKAKGSKDVW